MYLWYSNTSVKYHLAGNQYKDTKEQYCLQLRSHRLDNPVRDLDINTKNIINDISMASWWEFLYVHDMLWQKVKDKVLSPYILSL